jgi:hypothetical protein
MVFTKSQDSTRTIFVKDGVSILEDHSTEKNLQWISVRIRNNDQHNSDNELMDLIIERVESGEFTITPHAMHHQTRFQVSFPIMEDNISLTAYVTSLVKIWKEEIVMGQASVDRDYLFEPRH